MTRRRILNITTAKKNDAMQQITWVTNDGTNPPSLQNTSLNLDPMGFGGDKTNDQWVMLSPYIPTARRRPVAANTSISDNSTRESPETFAVGYSERVRITLYRGLPWMWRRIVFMAKGNDLIATLPNQVTDPQYFVSTTDNGMQRLTSRASPAVQLAILSRLFDGTANIDWRNPIDAKVDTKRVTLMSDRTVTLNVGNGDGRLYNRQFFYPIRKNLVYNDQEQGYGELESYFSTTASNSCGDMYIVDFFHSANANSGVTDAFLDFSVEGKYYWHER